MKSKLNIAACVLLVVFLFSSTATAVTVEITATVPGCGDGIINGGEQCDGANLGGSSCPSRGFAGGSLSCTSACNFNTLQCTSASSGSGGGGGGGGDGSNSSPLVSIPATNIVVSGKASPRSTISLLQDGQIVATTVAGEDARFEVTTSGVSQGNYVFGVYAEDTTGSRSPLLTFPLSVVSGVTIKVADLVIGSGIDVSKTPPKGDTNGDRRVNLIDFSVAAFWYKRSSPPATADLNADGKVDLVDFSILAFNWTG